MTNDTEWTPTSQERRQASLRRHLLVFRGTGVPIFGYDLWANGFAARISRLQADTKQTSTSSPPKNGIRNRGSITLGRGTTGVRWEVYESR